MKSILVALDGTPAAIAARATAISLAQKHAARLAGIGVLDRNYLTAPEPVPVGASHYKECADRARVKRAGEQLIRLVEAFETECRSHGVHGSGIASDGDPKAEVIRAAQELDLIVIGKDTSFHSEAPGEITATVEYLLKHNPRPVLITPADGERISPILIAYDGSVPAARALQLFALLDIAAAAEVHVLNIQAWKADARSLTSRAASYLELYDIRAHMHPIASSDDPAEILLAKIESIGAGIVVMGAFGHRGWREMLLGSCTQTLLRACPTSLFVHH